MIKDLIKLANRLDHLGLQKEADLLDSVMKKMAQMEEGMDSGAEEDPELFRRVKSIIADANQSLNISPQEYHSYFHHGYGHLVTAWRGSLKRVAKEVLEANAPNSTQMIADFIRNNKKFLNSSQRDTASNMSDEDLLLLLSTSEDFEEALDQMRS